MSGVSGAKHAQSAGAGGCAVVTGGSRGIGLAIARRLAESGCRVAICGRDVESLRAASETITPASGVPLALKCDVSNAIDVAQSFTIVGLQGLCYNRVPRRPIMSAKTTDPGRG